MSVLPLSLLAKPRPSQQPSWLDFGPGSGHAAEVRRCTYACACGNIGPAQSACGIDLAELAVMAIKPTDNGVLCSYCLMSERTSGSTWLVRLCQRHDNVLMHR